MPTDDPPRARPLFRPQAVAAQNAGWLGAIRIAQPIGDGVAAGLAVLVIVAIAAFASLGTYTRRATVPGLLEPVGGVLRLTTPATGTIETTRIVEGQQVAAGETLFVLSAERQSSSGATQGLIAAQLDARRETLKRDRRLSEERNAARLRATRERLDAIDVELAHLGLEAELHAAREAMAQKNVERFDELARTGFISPVQAQARLDEALVLRAQRENDRRVDANLRRERIGLASQLADSRMQAEAESLELARSAASLEQERTENEARRSTVVTAPFAATVTGIAAHAGQQVGAGGLLATLIPDRAVLEAQLFASARQMGFVEPGQRVRLRYAAYPYQKFGMGEGVVGAIEKSPYAPQELPAHVAAILGAGVFAAGEPVYRIAVTLDRQTIDAYAKPQALRSGMVFEADVLQDRRRLYEWLLEPIYGLAGR
jgi:membrane fusion protein